jgi:hypothetical protein
MILKNQKLIWALTFLIFTEGYILIYMNSGLPTGNSFVIKGFLLRTSLFALAILVSLLRASRAYIYALKAVCIGVLIAACLFKKHFFYYGCMANPPCPGGGVCAYNLCPMEFKWVDPSLLPPLLCGVGALYLLSFLYFKKRLEKNKSDEVKI